MKGNQGQRLLRLPKALSALSHRNFALFAGGQVVSLIGTWMQSTAQGWLVLQLTNSPLYLGITAAASTLPALLLTLPAGAIADRIDKRKIILCTQTVLLIQAIVLTILDSSHAIRVWQVIALAVLSGAANAVDVPARQSFTIELVGKDDLLNGIALNSAVFNLARVIGPAVAGIVVASYGTAFCFGINAASYLAALAALLLMTHIPPVTRPAIGSLFDQTVAGVRYALRPGLARDMLIMTGVVSAFGMQYGVLLPSFARDVLHVGPKGFGVLISSAGFGALLGAGMLAVAGHRIRPLTAATLGVLGAPIALIAVSQTRSFSLSISLIALIGLGMMSFLVVSNNVVQQEAPTDMRGRAMAARMLVFSGLSPIGALLLGWIAQRYAVSNAMLIGGIVVLIGAVWMRTGSHGPAEVPASP